MQSLLKDQWVSVFEECYEYALPQRESFFAETVQAEEEPIISLMRQQ